VGSRGALCSWLVAPCRRVGGGAATAYDLVHPSSAGKTVVLHMLLLDLGGGAGVLRGCCGSLWLALGSCHM
jgi:hypothetical protein